MNVIRSPITLCMAGALALVLLGGCQSTRRGPMTAEEIYTHSLSQCAKETAVKKEDCVYLRRMQYGIQSNFNHADRYRGRECNLTIEYGRNQHYSVLSTTGDEALCLKAWGVVSSAENLPPPPPHFPSKSVLVFRPG